MNKLYRGRTTDFNQHSELGLLWHSFVHVIGPFLLGLGRDPEVKKKTYCFFMGDSKPERYWTRRWWTWWLFWDRMTEVLTSVTGEVSHTLGSRKYLYWRGDDESWGLHDVWEFARPNEGEEGKRGMEGRRGGRERGGRKEGREGEVVWGKTFEAKGSLIWMPGG